MEASADRLRWIGRLYALVGIIVLSALATAAWWISSLTPERQAKRWGQVQLQSLRQSRERLANTLSSLDERLRGVAESPSLLEENPDANRIADEVRRALAGAEIDRVVIEQFDEAGKLQFRLPTGSFASPGPTESPPADLEEILREARSLDLRRRTQLSLERVTSENDSDTRVNVRYILPIWSAESVPVPRGVLIVRFPLKDFLSSLLIPSQLTPETYTFVIERGDGEPSPSLPTSILWHFRQPRWADAYLSDTDPFVRAITQSVALDDAEGYVIIDVPQADEASRREIVSWLQSTPADRRWLIGMSTPYADAVLSTRGQQSVMVVLGGLTLAVLGAGAALLLYQRTLLRIEAQRDKQNQLDRLRSNYQSLFAENPTAMIVLSTDGRLVDCNRSAENLIGMPANDAEHRRLNDLFEEQSLKPIWEPIEAQGFLSSIDARIVRRLDQKATLVEAWGRRIGEQVILMVQNVEERRDLDRQIARLRRMDSMGSLASTMAHDFNNILGQVQILVSHLRIELPEDSPWHADLATIEDKIEDASILVGNLLSFRENVLSSEPVPPEPVLREYVLQQEKILPASIQLVADIRPDLPSIWLAPPSLRRILDNLVRNACDAMPNGGTLAIRARPKWIDQREATDQLPAGNYSQIEVSDTGVGMSPQMLDTIFEPFFTTKTEGKGTGLGLWTIYKILRRVRGAVHVHSQVGRGTKVTIYLAQQRPAEDLDTPGLEMARPNR